MKFARVTIARIVTGAVVLMLLAALPAALRDTLESGRIYLFSREFMDDLPQRFAGPGRLRFIFQPLIALVLGCRDGRGDARAGRPPYLLGLLRGGSARREHLRSGLAAIGVLVAMGIALDVVAQFLIYREVHPGAALVVGPVLICTPYAIARALTNRLTRVVGRRVE
jgi:hypothetical protein